MRKGIFMTQTTKHVTRDEVPVEQTWDLTDLFISDQDWENELIAILHDVKHVTQYKGQLGSDADILYTALQRYESLQERIIRVETYATLKTSADGTNPTNQTHSAKVATMLAKVGAELSFIETEILSIPEETITAFFAEKDELNLYQAFINHLLEKKPYTLSTEVEATLATISEVLEAPFMIYQRTKASDMTFAPIQDADGNELPMSFNLYEDKYELSPDTTIRRRAYDSFIQTLDRYKHTFAGTYATEVTKQVRLAQLRGYESVTEMLLHPQQVSLEMYHNQLDVIQEELAPHMRRYARLLKQQLGVDELRFCDLKVSLDPEYNPKTTYDEAATLIKASLLIMGPEYSHIIDKAFANRWIDYAYNIGKRSGAFCNSPYGVHPYILITWTDTMRGAFTLAHELGHAGHFYLAGKNQTLFNTRPSMYFIEAPSTLNELLLADYLLDQSDDPRMKRWVIDQLLGTYYHNFITHLLEGEFQRRIYTLAEQGTPLTASLLCEQKYEVIKNFWGDSVVIDEGASLTWMRQLHYYKGLYPYTYSAGLTVSTAVAKQIKEEGKPAVERWLNVLKSGGTLKPLELIKKAGVDMSKTDAIKEAVNYVGSLVDQLEKSFE